MTKKHFEAFAKHVAHDVQMAKALLGPADQRDQLMAAEYAANVFATIAQADNGHFDRDRFLRACGL